MRHRHLCCCPSCPPLPPLLLLRLPPPPLPLLLPPLLLPPPPPPPPLPLPPTPLLSPLLLVLLPSPLPPLSLLPLLPPPSPSLPPLPRTSAPPRLESVNLSSLESVQMSTPVATSRTHRGGERRPGTLLPSTLLPPLVGAHHGAKLTNATAKESGRRLDGWGGRRAAHDDFPHQQRRPRQLWNAPRSLLGALAPPTVADARWLISSLVLTETVCLHLQLTISFR